MDTELERFKIEVVLPEFAAARGYSLDRQASSRNSIVMRHPDGDKIIIVPYEVAKKDQNTIRILRGFA